MTRELEERELELAMRVGELTGTLEGTLERDVAILRRCLVFVDRSSRLPPDNVVRWAASVSRQASELREPLELALDLAIKNLAAVRETK